MPIYTTPTSLIPGKIADDDRQISGYLHLRSDWQAILPPQSLPATSK